MIPRNTALSHLVEAEGQALVLLCRVMGATIVIVEGQPRGR